MHSVFVAGSRAIPRLNQQIRERLDNIMRQEFTVLVGDANGADKAVQRYLAARGYLKVIVYCMEECRNNLAGWPVRAHASESVVRRDRHYYGIKDCAMAHDATCGFMLWDGISKGTLTNVINLLNSGKKVLLYLSPGRKFFTLCCFEDLRQALTGCGFGDASGYLASLGIKDSASRDLPRTPFTLLSPTH